MDSDSEFEIEIDREVAEQHYSLDELSELWGLSKKVLTRLFEHEPGVLILEEGRERRTFRIAVSVAKRVYDRLSERK